MQNQTGADIETAVYVERNFSPLSTGHTAHDASVGRFASRRWPSNLISCSPLLGNRGWGQWLDEGDMPGESEFAPSHSRSQLRESSPKPLGLPPSLGERSKGREHAVQFRDYRQGNNDQSWSYWHGPQKSFLAPRRRCRLHGWGKNSERNEVIACRLRWFVPFQLFVDGRPTPISGLTPTPKRGLLSRLKKCADGRLLPRVLDVHSATFRAARPGGSFLPSRPCAIQVGMLVITALCREISAPDVTKLRH